MKQGDFTAVAKHYHNRPAYSPMLLEKLIACINDKNKANNELKVVEVGAGTGKLTRMLAKDFNLNITAVEPNDNMREEGIAYTKDCPNILWKKGSGEQTGVESGIADWVIMASSFHWTEPSKSLPEFARILGGGGMAISQPFIILAISKKAQSLMRLKRRLSILFQSLLV